MIALRELPAAIAGLFGGALDGALLDPVEADAVSDFLPIPQHSPSQVKKAGKLLSRRIPHDPAKYDEYVRLFKIAHDWRNSHAYPMRQIRAGLTGAIKREKTKGITAGRIKRMLSVRKKLSKTTITLTQIQDLGGCRAIVPSINDVDKLVRSYRNDPPHEITEDRSYIEKPRDLGYRSHHFVFRYSAAGEAAAFNGRFIEMQIRSTLQHAWATAVEAVGLVRQEDLKGGEGDPDWLRLFKLMGADLAEQEGCPTVPGTPSSRSEREREIKDLNAKLKALPFLENLRNGFKAADLLLLKYSRYYLIRFDNVNYKVNVEGFSTPKGGTDRYFAAESDSARNTGIISVLVEIDKVKDLKDAYPNYFLDVKMFTDHLRRALGKGRLTDADLSWVRRLVR